MVKWAFYRLDALPDIQPTMSTHGRQTISNMLLQITIIPMAAITDSFPLITTTFSSEAAEPIWQGR